MISIQSANWIVIKSPTQKSILEKLVSSSTIGEIVSSFTSPNELQELKSLLAAIFARNFASPTAPLELSYLEGYKMLNCYITNACNLRCEHCFMQSGLPLKNELTKSEWIRVLKEFKEAGGESVTFSGGEPLMNKDFKEILKTASNIGLTTTVLTNGLLWTESLIEELAQYIQEVQVSIDGVDESTNAIVRGKGHFDRVVQTVIWFANHGVRTSVATTFTLSNLEGDMEGRYKDFVSKIKSQCTAPVFFKLSKKILLGRNTHYSQEENKAFYNRIIEIERAVDPGAVYNNYIIGHTPNLVEKNCGFGGTSIGADGEVYYCNRISEVESYGNIRKKSMKDILELGHELHMKTAVDNIAPCKDCHLRYICCGGCRIDDCNFKGHLKNFTGSFKQITCNPENIARIERKMIDSFLYHYKI